MSRSAHSSHHPRPFKKERTPALLRSLVGTLSGLLLVSACSDSIPTPVDVDPPVIAEQSMDGGSAPLRLMTRNVYLGGDIAPVLQVDFSDIVAVTEAAATVWASVQANDFASRARRLAKEIDQQRPHIVGLQEAVRFISLDAQFQPIGVLDYVQILQDALTDRGLSYQVIVQENTDVTLPVALDLQAGTVTEYLKFTDRIAVLVREGVDIEDVAQGNYQAEFPLAPGVTLKRGWIRLRSQQGALPFTLVNTHLETQGLAPVQAGQATELIGSIVAGINEATFVLGDLNSDAAADPGAPSWTPTYDDLLDADFIDVWTRGRPSRPGGLTCCHDPDLLNPPGILDERIDFIMVRGVPTTPTGLLKGRVVTRITGDRARDRTEAGLWPSDHAGVAARLLFPTPLLADSP